MNDALIAALAGLQKVKSAPVEPTWFGVGGFGRLENPISDVLAFFLDPRGVHGFGELFLDALFCCLGPAAKPMTASNITIHREVTIGSGARIDLVIRCKEWVMIIENKIDHDQNNPFEEYARYGASLLPSSKPILIVLSPEGGAAASGWLGLAYKDYCAELRRRLCEVALPSKWLVYAQDFVLHLETELYAPVMTEVEFAFVDSHLLAMSQARNFYNAYRAKLAQRLTNELDKAEPAEAFYSKDEGWAIRCSGRAWGKSNLAFWYIERDGALRPSISAYLYGLSKTQLDAAQRELRDHCGLKFDEGSTYGQWTNREGFDTSAEAIAEFVRLGSFITRLFKE